MTIAYVNSQGTNATGGATNINNNYAPSGSNCVIVICGHWTGSPTTALTLTDPTRGNTIPTPTISQSAGGGGVLCWVIPNCIGGAGNWNVAGVAGDWNLDVFEYSGVSAAGSLDGTLAYSGNVTSGTTAASGNVTLANAGSMYFSWFYDQHSAHTTTATLVNARVVNQNALGGESSCGGESIPGSAGTQSNSFNWAGATTSAQAFMFGLLPAGGSNTGITPTAGSDNFTGNAPTVTPALNTVIKPFVARKSGVLEPDRRLLIPDRRIFLPTFKRAA